MKKLTFEQYSEGWWAARRGIPTASLARRIITPKGWKLASGAATVASELVADIYDPYYATYDDTPSKAMREGTLAEPAHRQWYELSQDVDVEQVGFCITDCGRFGCSPDGLVGEDGGLEIKRPQPATQVRYLIDGGVPDDYLPQVHWSLAVTGRKWWDFLCMCPGLPPLLVRTEAGEKTEQMLEVMEEFSMLYRDMRQQIKAKQQT